MSNYRQLSPDASPHQRAAAQLLDRRNARASFADYLTYIDEGYHRQWFHDVIARKLQLVHERKIKRLMIFMPPQHGKTSASTRTFPGWVLGHEPQTKIAVVSYSATIAGRFNRDIKRKMDSDAYRSLFPATNLGDRKNGYMNNNDIVEVEGKSGFIYTVGVGGSLTSVSVDLGIIDDPIKDRQDAQSITVRENTWGWYTDVFETRLHNDSAQVLIQTRWHQDDLAGRLLERDGVFGLTNPTGWVVVSFPALRTDDQNDFDPRALGDALWPEKHSQQKIEKVKLDNPITFNALYQQDPKPSPDALVFPNWSICEEFPPCDVVFNGLDFGYNHPSAWIKIGRIGRRLYVDERFYATGLTNAEIAQRMKLPGNNPREETYADSAEPKSIEEIRREGLLILPQVKGPDSINAGINKLQEFEVFVTRRSVNIIREKNNYEWIMIGGVASNTPIDAFNHAMDAIRGAVFTKYFNPAPARVKNRTQKHYG